MPGNNPFFQLPEGALPPKEVRFTGLNAEPWPDGKRILVLVTTTPFQKPPNLQATISDSAGNEVSNVHVIEFAEDRLAFTIHLRATEKIDGIYTLTVSLSYPDLGRIDETKVEFETHEASSE
jgi:hypothetical protein